MPFDCRTCQELGHDYCLADCPVVARAFEVVTVDRDGDLPPASPRVIDVALLDMHHGWPNLGHDAIVHAVQNAVCDIHEELESAGLGFRVISYDVRHGLMIPEGPGRRHLLYVGTGGPGELDPTKNDGVSPASQGINEDPGWERPLFALFDAILGHRDAVLLGVCHTFGIMCRWLGAATATLRQAEKGGKSAGIVENVLTPEAQAHPWFGEFARALPDHRRLRVLDNRLFDLVPPAGGLPPGITPIAYETLGVGGAPGEALTMMEVARDAEGRMPRVFGVNHHPEIINRQRQISLLRRKLERGTVTREWFEERLRTLTEPIADALGERLLHLTSSYTFMGPLRFHLYRLARVRATELGCRIEVDEHRLPITCTVEREWLSPSH